MYWKHIGVPCIIKSWTLNRRKVSWRWASIVDTRCVSQMPFKEGCVAAEAGCVVSRQWLQGVLQLQRVALPRTHPSLGSPYPVTSHCRSVKRRSLGHLSPWGTIPMGHVSSRAPKALFGLQCSSVSPSIQSCFLSSFPQVLLPNKYPVLQTPSQGLIPWNLMFASLRNM